MTSTIYELSQRVNYDPDTGIVTWKENMGPASSAARWANKPAGGLDADGYVRISFKYKKYKVHTLAWYMTYGEVAQNLDHINGDPADNRIANLRKASIHQNNQNRRMKKTNVVGMKGVSKRRDKFMAKIAGKYLGLFSTPEEAAAAYAAAAVEKFGEFARTQ